MDTDARLNLVIDLGAQIRRYEQELDEQILRLRQEHERVCGPLRARLRALVDGSGEDSEGDGGTSTDDFEPAADANALLIGLMRQGPQSLGELTAAIYGADGSSNRKCRARVSARISNMKKREDFSIAKRGGKFYIVDNDHVAGRVQPTLGLAAGGEE